MNKLSSYPLGYYSKQLTLFAFVLFLLGCSTKYSFQSSNDVQMDLLAEQNPIQHFDQEAMVTRIGQLLLPNRNLSKKERATMLFERGVLYDSLGLWALARYDFTQALMIQPKMAAIYNYLGLYMLLDADYDGATEAFNLVLHLDPNYEYAYLNRGLNFYYAGRYELAEHDFLTFYEADPTDPYRTLWLYLNELKYKPYEAREKLALRAIKLSEQFWGTVLVQYYLGQITYNQLIRKINQFAVPYSPQYAEVLTETYFYLAKQQLNLGNVKKATAFFKLAMANQVFNFVEYRFALLELLRLRTSYVPTKGVVTDTH